MLDLEGIKELTFRALQVESLLNDRMYEDIESHLTYFEEVKVNSVNLQQTDAVRVVYRVLKSCPPGVLKKKAKCLLSKWKLLYKDSCLHTSTVQEKFTGLRIKCRELLYQALSDPSQCQEKIQEYVKELEENIYLMYSGNEKKYRSCIRSKISNLKNPKNVHLKKLIYSEGLPPKTFAGMTTMEMANEELRDLRASYTQAGVQEHQLPQRTDGVQTSKIKCRKCERFNCTVTMISRGTLFLPGWVRTGNPDEEMMTFVICNECGEQWYHSAWVCL
ncbi:hypothetical protein GDO81_029838 [Engystomops pustulosus]|uniref:Transcription elongation factor A N-terminal and central domain containing n=1 Tax=Engystomops pustulosus TaxID=76066 RepID=A0AAV6Z0S4_ENGPU|nr:hypothetical protein GDO81_029838 [Engystomops pustulosus]